MQRTKFIFILLVLILIACDRGVSATTTITPMITPSPPWIPPRTTVLSVDCSQQAPASNPEYMNYIFPEPGCSYTIKDDHLIVRVGLSGRKIDSCPTTEGDPSLFGRVELYIDNQHYPISDGFSDMMGYIVENEKGERICMVDEGPWSLYWETTVTVGAHTGKLEIADNHGIVQEFTWNFEIWYETR